MCIADDACRAVDIFQKQLNIVSYNREEWFVK